MRDAFTTLVEIQWRWCLLLFCLGFVLSWLLFTALYALMLWIRGDWAALADGISEEERMPCISGVVDIASVYIFSCVSQHTIGYGKRCPSLCLS